MTWALGYSVCNTPMRLKLKSIPACLALLATMAVPQSALADGEDPPSPTPSPRHALAIGAGLRGDAVREDLVVPLTFSGPGVRLLAAYRGWVGPGLLSARGDLGLAFLFNRFGHIAATLDYNAEVAWTTRVLRGVGWHLSLGPAIALDSRVNYLYSWDDAHGYWLGTEWLGPMVRHTRRVSDRWRLEAGTSLALVGFEGRPPSYRYNKQDALTHVDYFFTQPQRSERFVTLADLQVLRIDVAFRHAAYGAPDPSSEIGRGWAFGVDVRFARTTVAATNINLGACLYAKHAWGW